MPGALATPTAAAETVREQPEIGLRERKKARLRRQIVDTSIRLFRKHGYEEHPDRRYCAHARNQSAHFLPIFSH